jgi:hypothetical protein
MLCDSSFTSGRTLQAVSSRFVSGSYAAFVSFTAAVVSEFFYFFLGNAITARTVREVEPIHRIARPVVLVSSQESSNKASIGLVELEKPVW